MRHPGVDEIGEVFVRDRSPGTPGAAVAVVHSGEIVQTAAYGLADIERDVANTPATVFNLGSVAKQFTAFAVFLLEADGTLALGDDVRSHLPELHDRGAGITLDHLLHHTSGLRDSYPDLMLLSGWRFTDTLTNDDTLRWLFAQRELNFEPGTEFAYANANYVLLAEAVARATGERFAAFCRRRIFEPLGMTRTVIHDDVDMVVPGRALGYYESDDGTWLNLPLVDSVVGPTNVYSTVEDLTRWLTNLGTADVGGRTVVSRMLRPGRLGDGTPLPYCGGLEVAAHRGHRIVEHGGQHGGYCAWVLWFPDDDLGVAVARNHFDWATRESALAVADLFLETAATEEEKGKKEDEPGRPPAPIEPPEAELRSLRGTYFDDLRSRVRIVSLEGGALSYAGLRLRALGPRRFAFADMPGATIEFTTEGLTLSSPGEGIFHYRRVDPAGPSEPSDYAGLYHSPELEVWWRVALEDGRLRVYRHKHPPTTMESLFGDVFADDWSVITGFPLTYTIVFERNGDEITGLYVSGDGVRRLRFERTT